MSSLKKIHSLFISLHFCTFLSLQTILKIVFIGVLRKHPLPGDVLDNLQMPLITMVTL